MESSPQVVSSGQAVVSVRSSTTPPASSVTSLLPTAASTSMLEKRFEWKFAMLEDELKMVKTNLNIQGVKTAETHDLLSLIASNLGVSSSSAPAIAAPAPTVDVPATAATSTQPVTDSAPAPNSPQKKGGAQQDAPTDGKVDTMSVDKELSCPRGPPKNDDESPPKRANRSTHGRSA